MDYRTRWGGTNVVPFVLGGLILLAGFIGLTYWGERANDAEITATGSTTPDRNAATVNPPRAPDAVKGPQPALGGGGAQPSARSTDTTAGDRP